MIVETKGLNLKACTLAELQDQEWLNCNNKYPFKRSKSELYTIPFCTGNKTPVVVTSDNLGSIICWKHSDDVTTFISDNYHVHSTAVDVINFSSDDQYLYSLSGQDSAICQWEVKVLKDPKDKAMQVQNIEEIYKNGSAELSNHIIREIQHSFAPQSTAVENKNSLYDTNALIKGSKVKLLSHVLATDKFKDLKNIVQRPPTGFLMLEKIYGIQSGHKRNTLKYYHFDCEFKVSENELYDSLIVHQNCKKWLIYYTSRCIVLENMENRKQHIYQGHKSRITCYTQHPKRNLLASGDSNSNIHVWNVNTREPIKIIKKVLFETGISSLAFSADGEFLLALGSGKQSLLIVNWEQEREVAFRHVNEALIFEVRFSPLDRNHILAIGKGIIMEFELNASSLVVSNVIWLTFDSPKNSVLLCMDFLVYAIGDRNKAADVYIGTSGGELGVLISHQFEKLSTSPIHAGAINCIKVTKLLHYPVCIITAGDDNSIKIWDLGMNLVCAVNVPGLESYKNLPLKAYSGSGIPLSHLNGIHSFDIYACKTGSTSMVIGMRCGDVVETEIITNEKDNKEENEKSMIEGTGTHKKIARVTAKGGLLMRTHSSLGKGLDERKLCIAMLPQSTLLVSSGYDCTLRLWNLANDSLVWTEDLGITRDVKVSALAFSPDGELLVVGLASGKVIYYSFSREGLAESSSDTSAKVPQISMRYSTHDATGAVLAIKFTLDCQSLAISHNHSITKPPMENPSTGGKIKYAVVIYTKNTGLHPTTKESYTKIQCIEIPVALNAEVNINNEETVAKVNQSNTKLSLSIKEPCEEVEDPTKDRAVIQLEFSKDGRYLQLCYLPVNINGKIFFNFEPTCIVWDISREAVAEDWDQLVNIEWNGFAYAPGIYSRHLNLVLKPNSIEEEQELLPKEQIVFSAFNVFDTRTNDIVCAGSDTGDLHVFRYPSLLIDKADLIAASSNLYGKVADNKENMGIARSCNACTSYIDKIEGAFFDGTQWVIVSSSSDEAIFKYSMCYEDCRWNLDYLYVNPALIVEDPFQELPSRDKFFILLNEKWAARSNMEGSTKQILSNNQGLMDLQVSWVYGRRAYDRRNNLKFDYLRRVVYPAGTMLIIVNETTKAQSEMIDPSKPKKRALQQVILNSGGEGGISPEISCIAMSTTRHLVAIGTAEAQAHIYVWDISINTEISSILILRVPLIYCMKMHKNERYIVAVGLTQEYKQIVIVADLVESVEICRTTQLHSIPYKIRDVEFIPGESYLQFVTCGIQHLSFWSKSGHYVIQQSAEMNLSPDAAHFTGEPRLEYDKSVSGMAHSMMEPPQQCGALLYCKEMKQEIEMVDDQTVAYTTFLGIGFIDTTMFTIADDGCIYIWEKNKIIRKRQGHNGAILCMDISPKEMLVATGGVDAKVVLWLFNSHTSYGVGHTDLEKIRSIHLNSSVNQVPELCYTESSKCVQSVCIDKGCLMVGTRTGSIHMIDIVDQSGNVKPKQSEISNFKDFLDGIDDETPQCIAFDPLQNRLCYLSKKGFFAVLNIETQLLIYSKKYKNTGKYVHMFRTSGRILLGFENEIIVLSNKYQPISELLISLTNITAIKVSNNDNILLVSHIDSGTPKITSYEIGTRFKDLSSASGFKSAVVLLDFTVDDNYVFVGDELGEMFRYETDQLVPFRTEKKIEMHLEWQSNGIRTDSQFLGISKFYSHTNKISAISRLQKRGDHTIIAVGDQTGSVNFMHNPCSSRSTSIL